MDAAEAIAAWRDFYGAIANAAAALLGLVFVGISLHLSLRQARGPVRSLATGAAITLLQPMLVALVMLVPVGAPALHAAGLLLMAGIVVIELLFVLRWRIADHGDSVSWLAYRFGIPIGAGVVLAAGGVGLALGWSMAVWAPAAFVFAMFVVGVQNAFDLVMGERGTRPVAPAGEVMVGGTAPSGR